MGKETLTTIVAVVVLAVWAAVALYDTFVSHEYAGLTVITPIMGAVAAYLFVRGIHVRRNGDDK